MGLFFLLTWVVFTLFGVNLTLKVEDRIAPFCGLFELLNIWGHRYVTPEKEFFKLFFGVKISPQKITLL